MILARTCQIAQALVWIFGISLLTDFGVWAGPTVQEKADQSKTATARKNTGQDKKKGSTSLKGKKPSAGSSRMASPPGARPGAPPPNMRVMPAPPSGQAVPGGMAPVMQGQPGSPVQIAPQPGIMPSPPGGQMVSMDFRSTDIDNILKFFSMATNWTITKDPGLTGQATIICPKQVSVDEAFRILQAVLEVRGFTGILADNVLKIMPIDRAVQSTKGLTIGPKPDGNLPQNQIVTQVIFPDNATAADLAKELQPLVSKGASILASEGANALIITDVLPNVVRILQIVDALDQSAVKNELKIFALKHADATQVSELITNLYKPGGAKGAQQPQPGMPPPQPPQPGQPGAGVQSRSPVVSVADTRTNAVIVVASQNNMERIARLIDQVDGGLPEAIQTKIIAITYADATQLANTLNSILTTGSAGRAAPQPQPGQPQVPFEQRVAGGGASPPAAGSKVIVDTRSNSLIVTARPDEIEMVERLVKDLDKEIKYETTTFIYPLENAQAQDVAYVLSQAFGQQQGGYGGYYPFIYFGPSYGGRERRRIQRRASQQGGSSYFRGGRGIRGQNPQMPPDEEPPYEGEYPEDFPPQDPNLPKSRQFYDYYYGPYGGRRSMDISTIGRDSSGRFVNLLQLKNNVLVVPDLNSNSLILTTTPDNVLAIKNIVKSLDVVPKQVLIEAIVAEATLGTEDKFGFEWKWIEAKAFGRNDTTGTAQGKFGVLPGGTDFTQGFKYTVTSEALDIILSAIATDKKVNILSTPRIFTSNNQEAEINISQRIPYVTNVYFYTGQANYSYDFLDVGIILNVTPRITAQGLVTVDVYQEANDLIDYISIGGSIQAPRIATRTADTYITVKDGETIIIGGIIKEDRNVTIVKVPILGDIPILKHLFRSKTSTKTKTELMVFLTPRVVSDVSQASRVTADQRKSIEKIMPLMKKVTGEEKGEVSKK